jgi:hypothetical protein
VRVVHAGGAVVRVDGYGYCGGCEQSTTLNQFMFADAIGEEAELTDTYEAGGQHVEQEAADELDCIEGHDLGARVIRVVFPVKADAAVFQGAQPVVGNGDAMSVASQILEHSPGSTEGGLDVNDPFEVSGCFTQGLESGGLGQLAKLTGEAELAFAKSLSQS